MDFLSKAFAQVADLFRSMTPGARIVAGLLLAVVVVSVGYLFNQQVAGPDGYLLSGRAFSSGELAAMEGAFGKAGLNDYEMEGNRIRIPSGEKSAYLGALIDNKAMPSNYGDFMRKMVTDDGPFLSKKLREQKMKVALQDELGQAIRGMKGIENASVLYDVKTKRGGRDLSKQTIATASVSVKPVGSQLLDEAQVRDIRHFVAGAIAELKPVQVSVTDQNGRTYPAGDDSTAGANIDRFRDLKIGDEKRLTQKIRNALYYIAGVVVSVNVELDPIVQIEKRETKLEGKAVTVESVENTQEESKTGGGTAGRPGVVPNSGGTNTGATVAQKSGPVSTKNSSQASIKSQPHGTETNSIQVGMNAKRVTVSVGVPSSYYEMVWRKEENKTPAERPDVTALGTIEARVKNDIAELVAAQLPLAGAKDPVKQVTVKSFVAPPIIEMPEPAFSETATVWFAQYWSTLGMTMLGLVSLLMLRSMVRSTPAAPTPPAAGKDPSAAAASDDEDEEDESDVTPVSRRLQRRGPGGPSLREELSELVREDPDAAAGILSTWIGTGA